MLFTRHDDYKTGLVLTKHQHYSTSAISGNHFPNLLPAIPLQWISSSYLKRGHFKQFCEDKKASEIESAKYDV